MPETRRTDQLRDHEHAMLVPSMTSEEQAALSADVAERGILTPVDITREGVVLDGRHRLQVARAIGLPVVPVRVVRPADEVRYIVLAALNRRHLSASQRAAVVLEFEEYEQATVATLPARGRRTRDVAARAAGVSPRTVQDVLTVRDADPALFAAVRDGTLPAHRAALKVRRARRYSELAAAPLLPEGPFDLIYADPPWQLGNPSSPRAPEEHYPTLSLTELKATAIPAAEDAVLFLWAVSSLLPQALELMEAWGFEYRTNLVWVKDWIGLGIWLRNRHELLLVGRRGNHPPPKAELRADSVIEAPRRRHSEKPEAAYELIERTYPHASKLELYARGPARHGWAAWGNEVAA